MTRSEKLKKNGIRVESCKLHEWYKVHYYICLGGKQYITFDYCMNTAKNPHAIQNLIQKLGNDFVAITEWNI